MFLPGGPKFFTISISVLYFGLWVEITSTHVESKENGNKVLIRG